MTAKHQRLVMLLVSLVLLGGGVAAGVIALRGNIVYFHTPSDIRSPDIGTRLRVGGLVEEGSVTRLSDARIHFRITDGNHAIRVTYNGLVPDLFAEGQGVIADGILTKADDLEADRVLAKHDENYMPPNVAEKLKETGYWRGTDSPQDENYMPPNVAEKLKETGYRRGTDSPQGAARP